MLCLPSHNLIMKDQKSSPSTSPQSASSQCLRVCVLLCVSARTHTQPFLQVHLFFPQLCWVFVAMCRVFSIMTRGGDFSLRCVVFSLHGLLLLLSMGPRACTLQHPRLVGSRAQAQYLCCMGSVALPHVGSSWSRDGTHIVALEVDSHPLHHQESPVGTCGLGS